MGFVSQTNVNFLVLGLTRLFIVISVRFGYDLFIEDDLW